MEPFNKAIGMGSTDPSAAMFNVVEPQVELKGAGVGATPLPTNDELIADSAAAKAPADTVAVLVAAAVAGEVDQHGKNQDDPFKADHAIREDVQVCQGRPGQEDEADQRPGPGWQGDAARS
jgi:hypothetical protein